MVIVVNSDQITQLQMTSRRRGLGGNTLHETSVAEEHICVIVDQVIVGLVKNSGCVRLGNCETNGVGKALTERAGGNLYTRGIALYSKNKQNCLVIDGSRYQWEGLTASG